MPADEPPQRRPPPVPSQSEPVDDLLTVRDWLRWGTSRFGEAGLAFGHGTSTALDEAAFLILSTLHLPIDQLEPWLDARLTPTERQAVHDIIHRRIVTRTPAAYLTGTAWIQGHRFAVDERVIVPRSYIGELLCDGTIAGLLPRPPARVLDLCTGSGCLAVLAALMLGDARVDATDISPGALEVARRNVSDHGLDDRIALLQGDLFAPLASRRYDLIVANPPYVAAAEVAAFPPEHRAEPGLAHAGGADGLDLVRRILAGAGDHLEPDGTLVMEIGTGRSLIEAERPDLPLVWLDTETSQGEVLCITAKELAGAPRRARGPKPRS